jgi:hypothetical protein
MRFSLVSSERSKRADGRGRAIIGFDGEPVFEPGEAFALPVGRLRIPPRSQKHAACANEQDRPSYRSSPERAGLGERIPRLLLAYWPLGPLVRWVARLRASVHSKLLGAFLLIALLLIAMGGMGLQSIASVARQSRLLDQARERVDASRQIEHALGLQMTFTRNALLVRDDATIESIFRENNRFATPRPSRGGRPPDQRQTIQRLRNTQDKVMATVAHRG